MAYINFCNVTKTLTIDESGRRQIILFLFLLYNRNKDLKKYLKKKL